MLMHSSPVGFAEGDQDLEKAISLAMKAKDIKAWKVLIQARTVRNNIMKAVSRSMTCCRRDGGPCMPLCERGEPWLVSGRRACVALGGPCVWTKQADGLCLASNASGACGGGRRPAWRAAKTGVDRERGGGEVVVTRHQPAGLQCLSFFTT
jgi:hypothetical protein